jgi:RNA polymerase sigma-70 factor (ECF subfamily)
MFVETAALPQHGLPKDWSCFAPGGGDVGHDEVSDDELVRRHRNGDVSAFPLLVKRHGPGLYAYILVRDKTAADDLYQETLLKVWIGLAAAGTYQPNGGFRSWFFRIAHNAWIDYLRRHGRPSATLDDPKGQQLAESIPSQELSPEDAALVKEFWPIIMKCVQECLNPDQRAAFLLVDVEQFTHREAADVLGVPIGTVISRVDRSRKQLRQGLPQRGIEP